MRRLSYPLSVLLFGPLAFFWPFAGGSGPFDLGPAPLRLGTCATSWTEGVYWSPRRGLFPSSSGHKRGSLGFALPLLRGKDLFITKCVAGTIHSLDCFFRGEALLLYIMNQGFRLFGASVKQSAACLSCPDLFLPAGPSAQPVAIVMGTTVLRLALPCRELSSYLHHYFFAPFEGAS